MRQSFEKFFPKNTFLMRGLKTKHTDYLSSSPQTDLKKISFEGTESSPAIFLVSAEQQKLTPSQNELLGKMIEAMGLKRNHVCIIYGPDISIEKYLNELLTVKVIVGFGKEFEHSKFSKKFICTHAIQDLENSKELKKATWVDLKKAMSYLA